MKSKSHFGFTLGVIALLSSQAYAGDNTDWVNQDSLVAGAAPSIAGLTVSAIGLAQSAEIKRRALKRLSYTTQKENLEKQVSSAEREYQIEKEKLEKAITDSQGLSKDRNVVSLEVVRQRKVYEKALEKYKGLNSAYASLDKTLSKNFGEVSKMRAIAKRDLETAKRNSLISKVGLAISVPVGAGIGIMSTMTEERASKAAKPSATSTVSQKMPKKAGTILTVPVVTGTFAIADAMQSQNMTKAQASEASSNASTSTTSAVANNQSAQ